MAGEKTDVAIVPASGYFNISPSSFVVSQPTPDGGMQIIFCDDFVGVSKMTVSADEGTADTGGQSQLSFETKAERVAYGRVKLSASGARGLIALLQVHLEQLEATLKESSGP